MIPYPDLYAPRAMRRYVLTVLLAGCAFLAAGLAHADDTATQQQTPGGFTLQAVGTEKGSYDSNPLLLTHGAKALYGSITQPELIFGDKTPTSLLTADTWLDANVFNLSDFDSVDFHSKAGYREQMQRWGLGLKEQTDYDTTRTSELTNFGLNGAAVGKSVRHLGFAVTPELSYNATPVDTFTTQASLGRSTYDNAVLADYDTYAVTSAVAHAFDPVDTGSLSLQAQRYQTTSGPANTVDTAGPSVGWETKFTPRFTGRASVGFQEARQFGSGVTQEPWTTQLDYNAGLTFKGEQDTTGVLVSRNDFPFGNGTEALMTGFTLTETHELNKLIALQGGASYQFADYQSSFTGALETLAGGNGGLIYHATDRLDVDANYQYRRETLTGGAGHADDHTVTLGLVYRPKAWTM
ncbi:MAG TPA: outer membrane beta-barrel protein [Alphaproteobacteria bacterium]|nr:outer membrane beta-barrel protein [Alphaproteobacteria bacterium]